MNGGETFSLIRAAVDENCIEFSVVPAPQVDEVELEIIERRIAGVSQGWFFVAFVIGQDLLNGTITPPGGAPLDLSISFPGEIGFISGSFPSSAALQAAFPPSDAVNKYDVSLNGGVATISLDFDPLIPDGGTTVTSPADMATVGSQPSFTVANTCTNCTTQFAEIFDIGTNGDLVLLELEEGLPPFSATIGLSDFGANEGSLGPITELPEDDYFFLTEVLNEDVTVESFAPTDDFDYFAGAFRDDRIEFTVPEPEGSVLVAAALVTLARLARRRQRS